MDRSGKWKTAAVERYRQSIEPFEKVFLLAMHFAGGQSSKVPEILGMRWTNTANGGIRNLFIEEGLVLFVVIYHRSTRVTRVVATLRSLTNFCHGSVRS
jgi:hypothetical protein